MLTKFRLENFKGHRDTELVLAPFTMLVGDNGSGKTSVLQAFQFLDSMARYKMRMSEEAEALDELFRRDTQSMSLSLDGKTDGGPWRTKVEIIALGSARGVEISGSYKGDSFSASGNATSQDTMAQEAWSRFRDLMGEVALYRFRAAQVAASSYSDQPEARVEEDGAQTAVVLAALKLADDEGFGRIEAGMRSLVPTLERIRIRPAKVSHPAHDKGVIGSKLYFDFVGAKDVPAHHASHGTLIALALLTVLYGSARPSTILLDDFDHALHPRAQMELVRMIEALLELEEFRETQIIATTHSPYVLDELAPENVIAFAPRDDGTVASKSLAMHPDAAKMKGTLRTGQLWSLDAERDWVLK